MALPVSTAPRFAVDGDSREIDRLVKQTLAESISVYQVFDDVLERLQPTHILTQIHCQVCAVSLPDVERSVAARLASRPLEVSLNPASLAEVWEDIRRVAQSLEIAPRGEQLVAHLQDRMHAISDAAHRAPWRPRPVESLEILAAILHPEIFPPVHATCWQPHSKQRPLTIGQSEFEAGTM